MANDSSAGDDVRRRPAADAGNCGQVTDKLRRRPFNGRPHADDYVGRRRSGGHLGGTVVRWSATRGMTLDAAVDNGRVRCHPTAGCTGLPVRHGRVLS